ncbi:MAG TPA: SsrA-binding protein SmpB [Candidatus Saccharibacteria bacterium]|mgnify:CR=1 FL=1|jgi:SsrA-binding protein|nr:SsrA-binding protein SmpB [Candidatus Saccharibacteria bacterium]
MKSKVQRKASRAKQGAEKAIRNKRARFDYALDDTLTVGIALDGRETKALRLGHGQLQGAYVTLKNNELWLINASIHGSTGIPIEDTAVTRDRKLLAKRREIEALLQAKQQGKTIVPLDILTRGRFIKVRIALGTGKRAYDKRQSLKRRDDQRNVARELSRH